MKKSLVKSLPGIIGATLIIFTTGSCKKISTKDAQHGNSQNISTAQDSISPCGSIYHTPLMISPTDSGGVLKVFNDQNNLYLTLTTSGGWKLLSSSLYAGKCANMPVSAGSLNAAAFPYQHTFNPPSITYTLQVPLNTLDSCVCISAYTSLVKLDSAGTVIASANTWAKGIQYASELKPMYFNYCRQSCSPCVIESGDFRTQTQGGWGAVPHGSNSGKYLHNHFAAAFPNGLSVGCTNTLKLTTAQAVTDFLPSGGPAAVLGQNYVNPGNTLNNVLAGQLVALSLSVGFDNYDPNFSASSVSMGSLVVSSGTFAGWSINSILAEANKVLGGCASNYTASQLSSVLASINENFDNGTTNNGFVGCP